MNGTWSFDYGTLIVSRTGGSGTDSVQDLYDLVQDTFDELVQLQHDVPMTMQTPFSFSLVEGWTIAQAAYDYLTGGTIDDTTNNDLYVNLYTLGALDAGANLYLEQAGSALSSWWGSGHIDVLIQVSNNGVLIDSGNVTIYAREWGYVYDHFALNLASGGRNAGPVATSADLNNQTALNTVAGWADVTVTFGTVSKNLNNGNGAKNYDVVVDCNSRPLAEVYERLKYITRRGATALLNGVQGQLYRSANAAYAEIKAAPFGTYAGGKLFAARGVWLDNVDADDVNNFQLIAADGTTQVPPNRVSVIVNGLVAGDRVGVFRLDAPRGNIVKDEMATSGSNPQGASTLNVDAIGTDVPDAGYVTVVIDANTSHLYTYTARTTTAFTGLSPVLSQAYSAGVDVFAPFLALAATGSTESNSLLQTTDIPVVVKVRKKGIVPFEVDGTIGVNGLEVTAVRTANPLVQ